MSSKYLGTDHIDFLPRVSIKDYIIADFLVKLSSEEPNTLSTTTDMDDPSM